MTNYSYTRDGNNIKFWTDNKELLEDVARYIQNCVDATAWRNRVERVTLIDAQEEEE